MAAQTKDVFANYAIIAVTESAANTLTFKKLETGVSLSDKIAWLINRIEYLFSPYNATQFAQADDLLRFGLCVSNAFAAAAFSEEAILDYNAIARQDFGAAASGFFVNQPVIKDFSTMPGGGLLVPPVPLYIFAHGNGLNSAASVTARMHYTNRPLSVDEYWELVEARRVISS